MTGFKTKRTVNNSRFVFYKSKRYTFKNFRNCIRQYI